MAKLSVMLTKWNGSVGPGEYYNPPEPENKGYYFNVSPREQITDLDTPGPGSYTVSTFSCCAFVCFVLKVII